MLGKQRFQIAENVLNIVIEPHHGTCVAKCFLPRDVAP